MAFISIAYTLKPLEEKLLTIDWKYHYGKLPPGQYRIIKSLFPNSDILSNHSEEIYVAAEFVI